MSTRCPPGFSNHQAVSSSGDDTQHVVTLDVAYVNVFFDGTENNYFNVTTDQKRPGQGSYTNALSNIARMWFPLRDDAYANFVYIDGAGTTRMQDDSLRGLAFGTGETGVEARVQSAFGKIVEKLKENRGEAGMPALLDINVFGFSRGAAQARYFVHLVNTEAKERFGKPMSQVMTRIHFVGLFDTVSSVGWRDVDTLHLRFAPNSAYKVFHLIAGDDYRVQFPSTTAASAAQQTIACDTDQHTMGYELRIPGAHSDVGGGYHPQAQEKRSLSFAIRDFVYQQGWYSEQDKTGLYEHQRTVDGQYHTVGLALMVDAAHRYTTVEYPPELLDPPQDPTVLEIRETLRAIAKEEKRHEWNLDTELGPEKARAFRRRFLHLSFAEGSVANSPPPLDANGRLQRRSIAG